MSHYSTQQKKSLVHFLQKNLHTAFTVKQIKDALTGQDISTSSVYRNVLLLEEEGVLQKIPNTDNKSITYQYVDANECERIIHLLCAECNKLFHLEKDFSELIAQKAMTLQGFTIDKQKTFIHGICQSCTSQSNGVQ